MPQAKPASSGWGTYRRPDGSTYRQYGGPKSAQDVEVKSSDPAPAPTPTPTPTPKPTPRPATESTSKPAGSESQTADYRADLRKNTAEGEQARKREKDITETGAGRMQEREAEAGDLGGLSIGERGQVRGMIDRGEATDEKDATAKIKAKRPKPVSDGVSAQAAGDAVANGKKKNDY